MIWAFSNMQQVFVLQVNKHTLESNMCGFKKARLSRALAKWLLIRLGSFLFTKQIDGTFDVSCYEL